MRPVVSFVVIAVVAATASAQPEYEQLPKSEDDTERISHLGTTAKPSEGNWFEIASPTPVKNGTEFIIVNKRDQQISQLRIDASGTVIVLGIQMFFEDGTARTVRLNRTLAPGRTPAVIDLPSEKPIQHIAITTARHTGGSYEVHARSN